jgi:hypothetical protein
VLEERLVTNSSLQRYRILCGALLALAVVLGAGATPGCTCDHSGLGGGTGDGGSGDGSTNGQGDGGANACGDNDPSCTVTCVGPTCQPPGVFPLPGDTPPPSNVGADGVTRDPNGYIILDQGHAAFDYLWIANDVNWGDGTVSKVSTKLLQLQNPTRMAYGEVARYATVTCMSDPANGSNETAVFSATNSLTLCADGVHGCCSRSEAVPGANGKHQPINLKQNRPSRTAVDFNGDVWVANRAHQPTALQSSVTKIANDPSECIDRNHNGKIDTSTDVNQDGIITTDCNNDGLADNLSTVCTNGLSRPEFLGYDDECVLFTTNTGPVGQYGRPLTLGPGTTDFGPADAWAGTWVDGKFYHIDGTTGLIKAVVTMANGQPGNVQPQPYGAAIDRYGILWAPNEAQTHLFYFDTNNTANQGMVTADAALGGSGFYGIAIDGYKDPGGNEIQQVWMGNVAEAGAYRYRPSRAAGFAGLANGTWARAVFPSGAPSEGRGIGLDNRDTKGAASAFAWVALDGYTASNAIGALGRIPNNIPDGLTNMTASDYFTAGQHGTLGAGVAIDLDIWGINQQEGSATHLKVDAMGNVLNNGTPDVIPLEDRPAAAENACQTPVGGTSGQCKVHPYTYSDFTGFGLRNFTNPHGFYSWLQTGCGPMKTKWLKVLWDASLPAGTNITMRARSADDPTAIGQATFTGDYPSSPTGASSSADLAIMPGPVTPNPSGFLQVEFDLTTVDKSQTPALKSFQIIYECMNQVN